MDADHLLSLIGLAYDAALGEASWTELGEGLKELVGGQTASIWVANPQMGGLEILCAAPMPDQTVQRYVAHYHSKDIWASSYMEAMHQRGPGGANLAMLGQEFIADDVFRSSEIYTDFYREIGLFHIVGCVTPVGEAGVLALGIHRPEQAGPFSMAERNQLSLTLPHLRRALQLRHRLGDAGPVGFSSLDLLPLPTVAMDAEQRLLHANAAARHLLGQGQAVKVERSGGPGAAGIVTASHRHERAALAQLVRRVGLGLAPSGAARLTGAEGQALAAIALPLPARLAESPALKGRGRVLLMLRDLERRPPPAEVLREVFGLSLSEADIAAALVGGVSAEQVAARREVTVATVRSQIRMIMTKTGAASLRDLERLLALLRP